jgi:hypothetical protein
MHMRIDEGGQHDAAAKRDAGRSVGRGRSAARPGAWRDRGNAAVLDQQ